MELLEKRQESIVHQGIKLLDLQRTIFLTNYEETMSLTDPVIIFENKTVECGLAPGDEVERNNIYSSSVWKDLSSCLSAAGLQVQNVRSKN